MVKKSLFIFLWACSLSAEEGVAPPRTRVALLAQPIANPGRIGLEIERTFATWSIFRFSYAGSLNAGGGDSEDKSGGLKYSESVQFIDMPVRGYIMLEDYFGFFFGAGLTAYHSTLKVADLPGTSSGVSGQAARNGAGWLAEIGIAYFVSRISFGACLSGSNAVQLSTPYTANINGLLTSGTYNTESINSLRLNLFFGYFF